jgi:hypothetical protein
MPDFTKSIVSSSLEIHSAGPLEEHPERFEQITLLNAYSSIVISAILLTMWFVILIASIAQFDSFISVTISIFSSAITVWIMRDNLRFYGQLRQIDESGAEKQAD